MGRSVAYLSITARALALLVTGSLVTGSLAGCADPGRRPAAVPTGTAATGAPAKPAGTDAGASAGSDGGASADASASASPTGFVGTAAPVTAADVPASWRAGCPVGPAQLSLLTLSHWGFDDRPRLGTLVVHKDVAADVIQVFRTLYAARFPIRSLRPVDEYGGSDDASMAADNTSGFNCRNAVTTGPPRWSAHAYGRAIDVNPVENPYLLAGRVLPPAGAQYLDRAAYRPGMAVPGGTLTKAFEAVGWGWAGRGSAPDYQHFSTSGR